MKLNRMKYNVEPIEGLKGDTKITGSINFYKDICDEALKLADACDVAYARFELHKNNKNAELEFHKEVKKYRKVFNHNVQDIMKHEKFRAILELTGRIKEYMTN